MINNEFDQSMPNQSPSAVRRVSGAIAGVGRGATRGAKSGVSMLKARLPGTMKATRAGAQATTSALQTMPDSTLRWLAASSVGLGAGLYLAGKQRLLIVAGVAPAVIMGAAIALRPHKVVSAVEVKS